MAENSNNKASQLRDEMHSFDDEIKFLKSAIAQLNLIDDTFKDHPMEYLRQSEVLIGQWIRRAPGSEDRLSSSIALKDATNDLNHAKTLFLSTLSLVARFIAGPLDRHIKKFLFSKTNSKELEDALGGAEAFKLFIDAVGMITTRCKKQLFADHEVKNLYDEGYIARVFDRQAVAQLARVSLDIPIIGPGGGMPVYPMLALAIVLGAFLIFMAAGGNI